jgi:alpha-beta hydrolase superfamily lysophospholipase
MKYVVALVAAIRVLWLGGEIKGDFSILSVKTSAGKTFIQLPINADTESKAKLSLFWNSRNGHAVVQRVEDLDTSERTFIVLENYGEELISTEGAWLSGWLGDKPEHFGYSENNKVSLSNGTSALEVRGDQKRWVIHVHGRKASYAETLRNFKQFSELGFSQLAISHETDPRPLGLGRTKSELGATEWKQLEVAVKHARSLGAQKIVLFGWSLGGLFVNQFLAHSKETSAIVGAVFDSPLLDYRGTLQLQAGRAGVDRSMVDRTMKLITSNQLIRILGFKNVPIESLTALNSSLPVQIPSLLFYSSNDGYISMNGVYRYQELNPKTRLVEIVGARHCRLFNEDIEKYQRAIADFVESNQI